MYVCIAGGIISIVRGFLLNFGVYYAVREALMIPFVWNPVVAFISSFMTVFASVIAVTKVCMHICMYVCMYVENCSGLIRFVMCFRIYVCMCVCEENVLYDKIFSASIVLGCLYVCMYVCICMSACLWSYCELETIP